MKLEVTFPALAEKKKIAKVEAIIKLVSLFIFSSYIIKNNERINIIILIIILILIKMSIYNLI